MSIWEENVRKVIPYTPGEQPDFPDMIKLNTNENPYPPSPLVKKALEEMELDSMRLYPAPAADILFMMYGQTCSAYRMNSFR